MATILIADDRPVNRDCMATLLSYMDHRVVEAADGAAALAAVRSQRPDLVICDVLMPGMDGYDFARQLRADPAIARTAVIFYTAHSWGPEARSLALACGVKQVLTKPCTPEEVLRAVDDALTQNAEATQPLPAAEFDQQHLRLVSDTLTVKAEELIVVNKRLTALVELSLQIGSESDARRMLDGVCRGACELLDAKAGALAVLDKNDPTVVHFTTSGMLRTQNANRMLSQLHAIGFCNRFADDPVRRGRNPNGNPTAVGLPAGFPSVSSFLAAPITSLNQTWGWVCLINKRDLPEFSADDERILGILGAQAGRVYENGSLYAKVQRHATQLEIEVAERTKAEREANISEAKYRNLIEQAADGIYLHDVAGNFLLVNTRGCELLGYTRDELLGLNNAITYVEEELPLREKRTQAMLAKGELRFERLIRRKDGSTFPGEISLKLVDSDLVQVIFHDITERRLQEAKIRRLSRIQGVLSGINSAIVRIRDRREMLREACRIAAVQGEFRSVWAALYDPAIDDLKEVSWAGMGSESATRQADLVFPPNAVSRKAFRENRTVIENDAACDLNIGLLGHDAVARGCGSVIAMPLSAEGRVIGVFTLYGEGKDFFDDEECKLLAELAGDVSFALTFISQQERVDYLAYYDPLTGMPNRTLFFERLALQLATAERERLGVALVLIDLDRFRLINDTLGRQAGDALLTGVAHRIVESTRAQDTVARVGANRFALAATGEWKTTDVAHFLEKRDRAVFGQPFVLGGEELRVSAPAGVAMFPGDADNAETLFANAEAALRSAKAQNLPFLFYGPDLNARVADSLRMENGLKRALQHNHFVLWYQPKISFKTGKVTGLEALMRWQDPDNGLVAPGRFIPVMEETGLIVEAGRWAMSQVARDCSMWIAAGLQPPRVAVNVSPLQLRQKTFVDDLITAAQTAEANGGALDIEITESVILDNVDAIVPKMQMIRGLGIDIYVDDFGTGYSSLAYIARLPIQSLKIDRSFVIGMTQNEDNLTIVKSVISLAHSLRLHVVAEGVETEEQATVLRELHCDEMQGYLISPPVPRERVVELLRRFD